MNLLKETIEDIKQSGHKPEDIVFIGSEGSGHSCSWAEFTELADRDYDSGFGAQKVAVDLVVVFSDGAKMWRDWYNGSEYWNYLAPFEMPKETRRITNLFVTPTRSGWMDLAEINAE